MERRKDFTPRKRRKITVFFKHSELKQKDITKEVNVPTQTVSAVRTNLELGREMDSSRMGKCGRKRKTTPTLDRKIKAVALQNRRASCKNISVELAHGGIMVDR